MSRDQVRTSPALWVEPPLPGMASCLTVQLNATYYRAGNSCRWVVICRDPDANMEVGRLIGVTRPDDQDALEALFADVGSILALVDYQLRGTVDDLKQALAEDPPHPAASPAPTKRRTTSSKA